MHRNALFEAVHNFSSFFHVLVIAILFSLLVMGINGDKTNEENHKHTLTCVKSYLQLIYIPHCILIFLIKSCAKLDK